MPEAICFVRLGQGDHPGYEMLTARLNEGDLATSIEIRTSVWVAMGSPKSLWVTLSTTQPRFPSRRRG